MAYGPPPPPGGGWGAPPPPPPPPDGGFGAPPPPPPPPPHHGPHGYHGKPASQGSAIAALIVSILMLCLCWAFALPAVILSIVGMVQAQTNPKASRTCTLIAWVLIGLAGVVGVIWMFIYGWALMPSSYDYYY